MKLRDSGDSLQKKVPAWPALVLGALMCVALVQCSLLEPSRPDTHFFILSSTVRDQFCLGSWTYPLSCVSAPHRNGDPGGTKPGANFRVESLGRAFRRRLSRGPGAQSCVPSSY